MQNIFRFVVAFCAAAILLSTGCGYTEKTVLSDNSRAYEACQALCKKHDLRTTENTFQRLVVAYDGAGKKYIFRIKPAGSGASELECKITPPDDAKEAALISEWSSMITAAPAPAK